MSNYDKTVDDLYEVSHYVNEFLELNEILQQVLHTLNESDTWGGANGVEFKTGIQEDGEEIVYYIKPGKAKSQFTFWGKKVSGSKIKEKVFSDIESDLLSVDKLLTNMILFAMRMNLHIRQKVNFTDGEETESTPIKGSYALDENGAQTDEIIEGEDGDFNLYEIGWIVDPVKLLCKSMGRILNKIDGMVQITNYNDNWGVVLRGAQETKLFHQINDVVYQTVVTLESRVYNETINKYPKFDLIRPVTFACQMWTGEEEEEEEGV